MSSSRRLLTEHAVENVIAEAVDRLPPVRAQQLGDAGDAVVDRFAPLFDEPVGIHHDERTRGKGDGRDERGRSRVTEGERPGATFFEQLDVAGR